MKRKFIKKSKLNENEIDYKVGESVEIDGVKFDIRKITKDEVVLARLGEELASKTMTKEKFLKLNPKKINESNEKFSIGDLVFVKMVGNNGLNGLIINIVEGNYEVYFRGLNGESMDLAIEELLPYYENGKNDYNSYKSIASKKGFKFNEVIEENLNGIDWKERFSNFINELEKISKKYGIVVSGNFEYGIIKDIMYEEDFTSRDINPSVNWEDSIKESYDEPTEDGLKIMEIADDLLSKNEPNSRSGADLAKYSKEFLLILKKKKIKVTSEVIEDLTDNNYHTVVRILKDNGMLKEDKQDIDNKYIEINANYDVTISRDNDFTRIRMIIDAYGENYECDVIVDEDEDEFKIEGFAIVGDSHILAVEFNGGDEDEENYKDVCTFLEYKLEKKYVGMTLENY